MDAVATAVTDETLRFQTARFGEVDVRVGDVITFPEGLIGFEWIRRYVILENPGGGPFRWLQAVDYPRIAFVVCDPMVFKPDYRVPVPARDLVSIGIAGPDDGVVVVILVVPRDARQMTANLAGPLVINARTRLARQVILVGPEFPARYPLFGEGEGEMA